MFPSSVACLHIVASLINKHCANCAGHGCLGSIIGDRKCVNMVWKLLIVVALATAVRALSLSVSCNNDADCPSGMYCYNTGECTSCTNCHTYLRKPGRGCVKHPSKCGPCEDGYGYDSRVISDDTLPICHPLPVTPRKEETVVPTTAMPEYKDNTHMIIIVSVVCVVCISVLVLTSFLLWHFRGQCDYGLRIKQSVFRNGRMAPPPYSPSAPPVDLEVPGGASSRQNWSEPVTSKELVIREVGQTPKQKAVPFIPPVYVVAPSCETEEIDSSVTSHPQQAPPDENHPLLDAEGGDAQPNLEDEETQMSLWSPNDSSNDDQPQNFSNVFNDSGTQISQAASNHPAFRSALDVASVPVQNSASDDGSRCSDNEDSNGNNTRGGDRQDERQQANTSVTNVINFHCYISPTSPGST